MGISHGMNSLHIPDTYEQKETTSNYLVEVAIGYKNGMWATKTVEADGPPHENFASRLDVEEYLFKQSVKEIEEELECGDDVLFYHLISTT